MGEKKPEIEILESRLKAARNIFGVFSCFCFALTIFSALLNIAFGLPSWLWFIIGISLAILTVYVSGFVVVQAPERAVIERFGEPVKILEPGLRWKIPIIETVRARPKVYEQALELFATRPQIEFRDGSATLKNPRIYVALSEKEAKIRDAIYKVRNWAQWTIDTCEPIIRGYLNTLSITEALDLGGARGNLIKRLQERPSITKGQIQDLENEIKMYKKRKEDLKQAGKDTSFIESRIERKEDEKKKTNDRLKDQKDLNEDFQGFIKEARARGIKKIHRIVVAEFGLSSELIRARERIHEEEKRAVAAISEAIRESTLRTESIRRSQEEFKKIGFSKEEALRKAYELDVMETLATTGSLFLTGGEGADLSSIVARVAAVFAKASEKERKRRRFKKKTK